MKLQKLIPVVLISLMAFSCEKKEAFEPGDVNYTGPKMVNFNNYEGYTKQNIDLAANWVPVEVTLKLSNTTSYAGAPITVKLVKDDNPINEYNTENGTSLTPVPVIAYRFDSTNVVISRGARTATVRFEVNPSKLDLSTSYAFGISIFSVSGDGATVSTNTTENSIVVELGTLNKYDGIYTVTGSFQDVLNPTAFTSVLPNTVYAVTSGASSVTIYRVVNNALIPAYLFSNNGAGTYYGNWGAVFTFDPSTDALTTVTNYYGQGTNPQGRSGAIDPSGNSTGNKFYPANHSIKAKYFMLQPNATTVRAKFDETYTYVGPR